MPPLAPKEPHTQVQPRPDAPRSKAASPRGTLGQEHRDQEGAGSDAPAAPAPDAQVRDPGVGGPARSFNEPTGNADAPNLEIHNSKAESWDVKSSGAQEKN